MLNNKPQEFNGVLKDGSAFQSTSNSVEGRVHLLNFNHELIMNLAHLINKNKYLSPNKKESGLNSKLSLSNKQTNHQHNISTANHLYKMQTSNRFSEQKSHSGIQTCNNDKESSKQKSNINSDIQDSSSNIQETSTQNSSCVTTTTNTSKYTEDHSVQTNRQCNAPATNHQYKMGAPGIESNPSIQTTNKKLNVQNSNISSSIQASNIVSSDSDVQHPSSTIRDSVFNIGSSRSNIQASNVSSNSDVQHSSSTIRDSVFNVGSSRSNIQASNIVSSNSDVQQSSSTIWDSVFNVGSSSSNIQGSSSNVQQPGFIVSTQNTNNQTINCHNTPAVNHQSKMQTQSNNLSNSNTLTTNNPNAHYNKFNSNIHGSISDIQDSNSDVQGSNFGFNIQNANCKRPLEDKFEEIMIVENGKRDDSSVKRTKVHENISGASESKKVKASRMNTTDLVNQVKYLESVVCSQQKEIAALLQKIQSTQENNPFDKTKANDSELLGGPSKNPYEVTSMIKEVVMMQSTFVQLIENLSGNGNGHQVLTLDQEVIEFRSEVDKLFKQAYRKLNRWRKNQREMFDELVLTKQLLLHSLAQVIFHKTKNQSELQELIISNGNEGMSPSETFWNEIRSSEPANPMMPKPQQHNPVQVVTSYESAMPPQTSNVQTESLPTSSISSKGNYQSTKDIPSSASHFQHSIYPVPNSSVICRVKKTVAAGPEMQASQQVQNEKPQMQAPQKVRNEKMKGAVSKPSNSSDISNHQSVESSFKSDDLNEKENYPEKNTVIPSHPLENPGSEEVMKAFMCESCGISFATIVQLRLHIKVVH